MFLNDFLKFEGGLCQELGNYNFLLCVNSHNSQSVVIYYILASIGGATDYSEEVLNLYSYFGQQMNTID